MSIFRRHKSIVDRSAADRARHKKKIEKAIKESIKDVIADESIIGQNGKKKIRIPVKGIKEYRFVYGANEKKQVGSAGKHHIRRGQKVSKSDSEQGKSPNKKGAGNEPGEEKYDVEITLEELAEYLFNDLELPELEKKNFRFVDQAAYKRKGYRFEGIRPRLSKKETLKRKIRRKKKAVAAGTYNDEEDERFPFHKDDMKYHHIKAKPKENTSAVVFLLMDVSGSMTPSKKFIARSYFFLMYQFLRYRYDNIDVVFISHTTDAQRVTEDQFFKRRSVGGTMMSSGLELKELKEINQLMVYAEIKERPPEPDEEDTLIDWHSPSFSTWTDGMPDSMWTLCTQLLDERFKKILLSNPNSIWPMFKKIFGAKTHE